MAAVTDIQVTAAIAPKIAVGLDSSAVTISFGFVVYSIAAAAASALLIRFPANLDPAITLPWASWLYGAFILVSIVDGGTIFFLAGRIGSGLAGGMISTLAITSLAAASEYRRRGASMNFLAIGYYAAPMLGVPAGVVLAEYFQWQAALAVVAIIFAFAGFLTKRFPLRRIDPKVLPTPSPVSDLSTRSLRLGVISAFFVSGGVFGFTIFVGTWAAEKEIFSAFSGGTVYLLINLAGFCGALAGGFLADRFGKRYAALFSSLLMAGFLFAGLFAAEPAIKVLFILGGAAAAALRVAPMNALVTELVRPARTARYVATRNISSQLGIAASIFVCGQLYAAAGYRAVLFASAVLTLVAWITIWGIDEPRSTESLSDGEPVPRLIFGQ